MKTLIRNKPTRRAFMFGLAALGATALLPRQAAALSGQTAKSLVDKLVAAINGVIASGKSEAAMIRDFEAIFVKYADVNIIARSCLGADARRFSSSQIAAYTRAFQGYIGRKYGKRFREFIGGKIAVESVKTVKTWQEVSATAYLQGRSPFDLRFMVSDTAGRPLFFDMLIEGVSMRLSERTEIGAMLDANGGDIARLTEALKRAG